MYVDALGKLLEDAGSTPAASTPLRKYLWSFCSSIFNSSVFNLQSPDQICRDYPKGPRLPADRGTWNTYAVPTTDECVLELPL